MTSSTNTQFEPFVKPIQWRQIKQSRCKHGPIAPWLAIIFNCGYVIHISSQVLQERGICQFCLIKQLLNRGASIDDAFDDPLRICLHEPDYDEFTELVRVLDLGMKRSRIAANIHKIPEIEQ